MLLWNIQKCIVQRLQLGSIENLAYWMGMQWLPGGMTFQLCDRSGTQESFDVNGNGKTYVYASHTYISLTAWKRILHRGLIVEFLYDGLR
jgi:hypothetical protein